MKLRYASKPSGRPFSFTPEENAKIDAALGRYPTRQAALLPVLWIVQGREGWVSREAVEAVAERLGLTPAFVDGVLTFYTMYNLEKIGRHHLQFCTSISCHLNGGEELYAYCRKKLGVGPGETTPDGKFTVSEVECIAGCDRAPSMQVNDLYHEPMTREKLDALIDRLAREG
jgi:NADH-quinone oxidoreductase subunit E